VVLHGFLQREVLGFEPLRKSLPKLIHIKTKTVNAARWLKPTVGQMVAKLVLSKANVRKTEAEEGLAELAASIAVIGLRQNLNVSETDTGRFEKVGGVDASGR
jgi:hypothetical protein